MQAIDKDVWRLARQMMLALALFPLSFASLAQAGDEPQEKCGFDWSKNPPVTIFPRPGLFTLPPTGEGYYSLQDYLEGNCRKAPPAYPYVRFSLQQWSFANADFRYLDKPDNQEHDFFDCLKRIHLGDSLLFTTGGEFRFRYENQVNHRLSGINNTYDLLRTRVYGDLWYEDKLRLYAEFIDSQAFNQDLNPTAVDINRSDMLDFFIDLKVGDFQDQSAYLRAGRQELLYGSQRLLSPIEWANVRRSFQGVKAFWHGEQLDVDLFCVQSVVPNPSHFDSVDPNAIFSGLWTTYRPEKTRAWDLYYLNLDQAGTLPTVRGIRRGPFNVSNLGTRYSGDKNNWLWDLEANFQLGSQRGEPILAEACTTGFGYHFKDLPAHPQLWLYYDYASGDSSPGTGDARTFNQLFAFGHHYLGAIDLVGRSNIHDFNGQLTLYPTRWITLQSQFHVFQLADAEDALYNIAGVPLRRDPTGRAGRQVGQEIDFLANLHLTQHQDLLMGYVHFNPGSFIEQTSTPVTGRAPDFFYLQYSYRW